MTTLPPRSIAGLVAGLVLCFPAFASAQFATPADRQCIEAINLGVRKVAGASAKQLRVCAGYSADGLLGPQSIADCATALVQGPVAKALLTSDRGVALDQAFPGCGVANDAALGACLDERIRCRACLLLNAADGLARDCDVFDDGTADASCS
jgi:hypothetical protein